jgi:hypothetical protein
MLAKIRGGFLLREFRYRGIVAGVRRSSRLMWGHIKDIFFTIVAFDFEMGSSVFFEI